jgi:hypothetical protein
VSDADDRFLETLAGELDPLFGPRLALVELRLERPDETRVRITALVRSSAGIERVTEEGDSLTMVAATLMQRAPIHRLADGFREVVEPATIGRRTAANR